MLGCWGPKALGGWRVEHWHSRLGLGGNAPAPAGFTSREERPWGGGGEGAPAEEAPRPLRPSPAQRSQPCGPQRAAEELSLLPSALD